MLPSQHITNLLKHSTPELKHTAVELTDAGNANRNQLLMPDYRNGLYNALTAYREVLVDKPLVIPMRREIKVRIDEYRDEWSRLFDAVRKIDKQLEPQIKAARSAQKAAHRCFIDILTNGTANGNGRTEYDALAAALTALSEQMGENALTAAARSEKKSNYNTYKIHVTVASKLIDVPAVTLRRILKRGNNLLATALDSDSPDLLIAWGKDYKRTHKSTRAAKHEANAMNHPIPLSSVGKKPKRNVGLT